MHHASFSFPALLQNLSSGDSTEQLLGLTELCEVLSLSTEEQLLGFRVSDYVRVLVHLLDTGESQDIMLLCARALTNLLEVLPAAAALIVSGGGASSLCGKLLNIDSIDVAEQALLALSKLAVEQPAELLREGALAALMQNVVFFPTSVQRTAFVAAANIVQEIDESLFAVVMKSAPLLLQHLEGNTDEKTVSQIFLFFSRVISQTGSEEHLGLHATDYTNQACHALKASTTKASLYTSATVNLIVSSLLGLCQSSVTITLALLQLDVASTISGLAAQSTGSLLHDLLALALELLPEDLSQPPALQLEQAQESPTIVPVTRLLSEERPYDPTGPPLNSPASSPAEHTDFSSLLLERPNFPSLMSQGLSLASIPFASTPRSLMPLIPLASSLSSEDSTPASDFMTASPSPVPLIQSSGDSIPFFSLEEVSLSSAPASTPPTLSETPSRASVSSYDSSVSFVFDNSLRPSSESQHNVFLDSSETKFPQQSSSPSSPSSLPSSMLSSSSSSSTVPPTRNLSNAPSLSPVKLAWFKERPVVHCNLAQELMLMFVRACNATASASIRHLCVRGVLRIILSTPSIEPLLLQVNLPQFAGNLLQLGMQNADHSLLSAVLTIIDTLVTKLPLREELVRSGVADKIRECARSNKRLGRKHASPFMSPYSSPGQLFSLSSATAHSVQVQAQACLLHFPEEAHTSTPAEQALRELGMQLGQNTTDTLLVLSNIKEMLANKGSITAHELVRSDIAKFLVEYLSQADGDSHGSTTLELQAHQRLFCHVFFGLPNIVDFCADDGQVETNVLAVSERTEQNTSLVVSFKAALEAVEQFVPEIYDDRNFSLEGMGLDPRIELLGQPFKVKLSWKEDESTRPTTRSSPMKPKTAPAFAPRVVLADALASMRSIETYLLSQEAISALFPSVAVMEKKKRGKEEEEEVFIREAKKALEISRPIHLGFEIEGVRVSHDTSVLKAVQLTLQARGEAGGDCKAIWDKTYDIQFFKVVPIPEKAQVTALWPSPARLSSLVEENLKFSVATSAVDQLLQLLRCCFDLSQQWPLLYSMNAEGLVSGFNQRLVSPLAFVSEKLSKRVQMQIEDPIAVCGGCFPEWCIQLCQEYPFMLSLSVRRLYFKLTAFNTSQHLHTLETHLENSDTRMMEGSPRLEREGSRQRVRNNPRHRIQQLKLRVHRSNVLEVSCDLMETYAKRRGFIRAEFLGEEGVGLGPTLELFALVSQKIQLRKLGLWFDQDADPDVEEKQPSPVTIRASLRSSKKNSPTSTTVSTTQFPLPSSSNPSSLDRTRAKEFHRLGVCVCRGCHLLEVPHCSRHNSLFTQHQSGQWSCPKQRCTASSKRFPRKCKLCEADREMQEWLLSDQEATYLKEGFPSNSTVYPHLILRCTRCLCINFPGTEKVLTINRGGQIVTHTGRVMTEKDFRCATQHLTTRCSNSALETVPVLMSAKDAYWLANLIPLSPSANADSSLQLHDDPPPSPATVPDTSLSSSSSSSPTSASSIPTSAPTSVPSPRMYPPNLGLSSAGFSPASFPVFASPPLSSPPVAPPSFSSFSSPLETPSITIPSRSPSSLRVSPASSSPEPSRSPLNVHSPLSITGSPSTVASSPLSTPVNVSASLSSFSSRPPRPRSMSHASLTPSPTSASSSSSSSSSSLSIPSYFSLLQSNFARFSSSSTIRAPSPLADLPVVSSRSRSSSRPNLRINSISPVPTTEEVEEYVSCPCGVFPSAFGGDNGTHRPRLDYFRFLGRLMGQALLEDRLLDIPLSAPFLNLVLNQPLSISSLLFVNPFVGKSMVSLQRVAARAERSETPRMTRKRSRNTRDEEAPDVQLLGCPLADLVLDFTVPGHPNRELKPGGANCAVSLENVREYVGLVCSEYLRHHQVQAAVGALRQGLGEVVHLPVLNTFSPSELQELLCGGDSDSTWDFSVDTLKAHVVGRQGYTTDSRALQWLFDIVSAFSASQQRAFVRFVTGSPRLPVGGLKSLKPPLSVIRVPCVLVSEAAGDLGGSPVSCSLPSAMTCSSYLKLPDYPSKELMKQKLLYSMQECQTGFQLS